jgi:hypothetical protein
MIEATHPGSRLWGFRRFTIRFPRGCEARCCAARAAEDDMLRVQPAAQTHTASRQPNRSFVRLVAWISAVLGFVQREYSALNHIACASLPTLRCNDSHMRFIEDDKLPTDVVRKEYSESRHALGCLNCGFESEIAPNLPDSIGKPPCVLMVHDCPSSEAAD